MTTVKRPALRYHGGKWKDAKWIISHFPRHRIYIDIFGGGGSVLLRKPRSYAEVYNDKWNTVVNVFKVLRDPAAAKELERVIRLTPFSRTEFMNCGEVELMDVDDPIEKARRTIFRSFAGFGSASTNNRHATGFRANSNRSGTTPAHDWVNWPDNIQAFTDRLQGVVIENRDYREVLKQHDSPDALIYADPPYVHATRNMARGNSVYAYDMNDTEQLQLAEALNSVQGYVVLSGYESELYAELYKGWRVIRKASFADGAEPRVECLWLNPKCASEQIKMFS